MNHLNLCTPLVIGCDGINYVAFDGCAYYCTITNKKEIYKLDTCLDINERYCTSIKYDCICYDFFDHCFWASSKCFHDKVFKLDCHMNTIDCIKICGLWARGEITGISYNCCKNSLIISYPYRLIEVDKTSNQSTILYTSSKNLITGVLSLCPCILVTVLSGNEQYIELLNCWGEKINCCHIDKELLLINLIYNPCSHGFPDLKTEGLVLKKNCFPYLCKGIISCDALGFEPCPCNERICHECCCDDHHCHKHDACSDVIESIALIEAAISHILNAEGEKLQKVLAETNDIDKILCVNREINKTIVNATHLEHVLHAKLSTITESSLCCHSCGD